MYDETYDTSPKLLNEVPDTSAVSTPPSDRTSSRLSRYPSSLSRATSKPGAPARPPHNRGSSRTYESLEDLLVAAGYKETRVVTPVRVSSKKWIEPPLQPPGSTSRQVQSVGGAVGKRLSNFLASWMPGAPSASERARQAQIEREEADAHSEYLSGVDSPLPWVRAAYKDSDKGEGSVRSDDNMSIHERLKQKHHRSRPSLPESLLESPSHRPTRPTRGATQIERITPTRQPSFPRLRHASTSPDLKRTPAPVQAGRMPRQSPVIAPLGTAAQVSRRGRQLVPRNDATYSSQLLDVPERERRRKSSRSRARASRFSSLSRNNSLTPASAVAPVLHTGDVVCRSQPQSRSVSRVRNSARSSAFLGGGLMGEEVIPPVPPLLSAAVIEDTLNAWAKKVQSREGDARVGEADDENEDGDDDDEEDPDLGRIISGRISPGPSEREYTPPGGHTPPLPAPFSIRDPPEIHDPWDSKPISQAPSPFLAPGPAPTPTPFSRPTSRAEVHRTQSIASLRSHLVPRRKLSKPSGFFSSTLRGTRGRDSGATDAQLIASLYGRSSSRAGKRDSWLDGPEWDDSKGQSSAAQPFRSLAGGGGGQSTSKRAPIPWFGEQGRRGDDREHEHEQRFEHDE